MQADHGDERTQQTEKGRENLRRPISKTLHIDEDTLQKKNKKTNKGD